MIAYLLYAYSYFPRFFSIQNINNRKQKYHHFMNIIKQYRETHGAWVVCIVIQELNKFIIRTNYVDRME